MTNKTSPRRQSARAQRAEKKRQQRRLITILMIAGGVILILVLAIPSIIQANKPVGEFAIPEFHERVQIDFNTMGDPNAPVKIVEYSDFRCSFCKLFSIETEPSIIQDYVNSGKVFFVYVPYGPGGRFMGAESEDAANAAFCAAEQGRFWDYKDIIFANQTGNVGDFTIKKLAAFAETLNLEMDQFNDCLKQKKYQEKINEGIAEGRANSVGGTPSFVFNDGAASLEGAHPYQSFKETIDALLNQ